MTVEAFPGQNLLHWLEPIMGLEAWMPPAYRRYAPLIREGLAFFLSHLPQDRLDAIVNEQLTMGDTAPMKRLTALMQQCPVLHKLAQVLAHDQRLDRSLREQLGKLETLPANLSTADADRLVRRELGHLGDIQLGAPMAEASVAVVVPYRQGRGRNVRDGVLKILKPGIEQRLADDLRYCPALSAFLEDRAELHGLERLQYRATLDSVEHLLRAELRLDIEQKHLARAASVYTRSPNIKVPELYPECTPRITAMERLYGRSLAEIKPGSVQGRQLGKRLLNGLFVEPLMQIETHPLVHGDPHPGNLLVTEDGRIGVMDWALAAELDNTMKRNFARLILAAVCLDSARVTQAVSQLGRHSTNPSKLHALVDEALRTLRWGGPLNVDWILSLLDAAAVDAGTYFPEPLIILRKSLQMAFGVFEDLSATSHPGATLTHVGLAALGSALVYGQLPAVGLETEDWLNLFASAPLLPGRYWLGLSTDVLKQTGTGTTLLAS